MTSFAPFLKVTLVSFWWIHLPFSVFHFSVTLYTSFYTLVFLLPTNVVWELICLQIAPPWHSRPLCPKAVWIYRHEWWRAAWSRCWGGGTAHVGSGPVVFQRAWVWFRVPTPAHTQNQGRDHLHHCWLSAHCYVETYCRLSCQSRGLTVAFKLRASHGLFIC